MQPLARRVAASDRRKKPLLGLALPAVVESVGDPAIAAGCELLFEVENLQVADLEKPQMAHLGHFDHFEKPVRKVGKLKIL